MNSTPVCDKHALIYSSYTGLKYHELIYELYTGLKYI